MVTVCLVNALYTSHLESTPPTLVQLSCDLKIQFHFYSLIAFLCTIIK